MFRFKGLILIQASSTATGSGRVAIFQNLLPKEDTWLRFYTQQHNHYCGIDLHAKAMYVCLLDQHGMKLVHKNLPTTPEAFWRLIAPYREDLVVGVECMFTWYWLADLCQQEGIAFVLGHALYMKAIHDCGVVAGRDVPPGLCVSGGAAGDPRLAASPLPSGAQARGTLGSHPEYEQSVQSLPEIGKKLAHKANREGVEDHFPDPSVRKTIEVEVSLIDHYDQVLWEVELYLTRTAKVHDGQSFTRRRSVPGIGPILALVILYEIQDITRFPRVQDFVSYCRLVKCAKESDNKRLGTSGKKIGNVHLRWAFAEAAVLFRGRIAPRGAARAQVPRSTARRVPVSAWAA